MVLKPECEGITFRKGSKNEWFWRDIENITRKGDHGQEALWFPRVDDRWKSS